MAARDTNKHQLDITGQEFGRLRVLSRLPDRKRIAFWLCRCSCSGITIAVDIYKLLSRWTRSCGCLSREAASARWIKHGYSHKISEYNIWKVMKARCYNTHNPAYPSYGGRGIKVCERWLNNFPAFLEDMGPRPSLQYSIGRKDNDGDYCPENCKWETISEQNNNTRQNCFITYDGQVMTIAQAAQRSGISYSALKHRINRGWPEERWFEKEPPILKRKPS